MNSVTNYNQYVKKYENLAALTEKVSELGLEEPEKLARFLMEIIIDCEGVFHPNHVKARGFLKDTSYKKWVTYLKSLNILKKPDNGRKYCYFAGFEIDGYIMEEFLCK